MSDISKAKNKLTLSGFPPSWGLLDVQEYLNKELESPYAIDKAFKCKDGDKRIIPGKFAVVLRQEKHVQVLVSKALLYIEYDDALYCVNVTKSRPNPTEDSSPLPTSSPVSQKNDSDIDTDFVDTDNCSSSKSSNEATDASKTSDASSGSENQDYCNKTIKTSRHKKTSPKEDFCNKTTKEKHGKKTQQTRKRGYSKYQNTYKSTWFDILQKDPEVFQKNQERCLVVTCDDDDIFKEDVLDYLKNNAHHDNVEVKKIYTMSDGIMVILSDKKVAKQIASKETHFVGESEVRICFKSVPTIYKDRILFTGNFEKEDDVHDVLECCTTIPFKVKKLEECDMFLVVFDKNFKDVEIMKKKLKKIGLKETKPKILSICRSDCVKIQNLKPEFDERRIRMSFMKNRFSDGDITFVERDLEDKTIAYVYFSSYKDAEKLVDIAKDSTIAIKQHPVKVSLYCPKIKDSLEIGPDELRQFIYNLKNDSDAIRFIQSSNELESKFYKDLGNIAQVEIIEDKRSNSYNCNIKPLPTQDQQQVVDQEEFEVNCQNRIKKFFKQLTTSSRQFFQEDLERVRKENQWSEEEQFIEMKVDDEIVKVFVRWNDQNGVKVTGFSNQVILFFKWLDNACKQITLNECFDETDFNILIQCGIVEEISGIFKGTVEIEVLKDKNTLVLTGAKASVKSLLDMIKNNLKRVVEEDMKFLHPAQKEYLERSLRLDSTLVDCIQEKLLDDNIRVYLHKQKDKLFLKYNSSKIYEIKRAKEVISNLLKFQVINVEGQIDELNEDDEWNNLKKDIESSGKLCLVEDFNQQSVVLVGFPSNFNKAQQQITEYLEVNAESEKQIVLPHAEAEFFSSFSKEIGADRNLSNVEWYQETGGIHLKGKARDIDKAANWIEKTAITIISHFETLCIPGMETFLRGDSGKQFIKTTSKEAVCCIFVDYVPPTGWNDSQQLNQNLNDTDDRNEQTFVNQPQKTPKKGFLQNIKDSLTDKIKEYILGNSFDDLTSQDIDSVALSVINGDILDSNCDVMINTVGWEFNLKLSKLSSAMLEKTGSSIEHECKNNPQHSSHILRVTSAPNLKFHNIIHLVTPKNPEKVAEHLYEAFKIVESKLKLSSLAIPAIGTGQIGMTDIEVAKGINAAVNIFRSSKPKHLKKIEVVVYQKSMMSSFEKILLNKTSVNSNVDPPTQSTASANQPNIGVQSSVSNVSVKSGDILLSSCEVIFNTVGSDFNLKASQLSAKLLQAAGDKLIQECQSAKLEGNACKFTGGGNTKFKVIVQFITPGNSVVLANNLELVLVMLEKNYRTKSVAIPAIGTGNAGLNVVDVAKAFGTAINNFLATNPIHVKKIEVVIFDTKMLSTFQANIQPNPVFTQKPTENKSEKKFKKSKLKQFKSSNEEKCKVEIYFTSNNETNIEKAWSLITKKAEAKCNKKIIVDDVLEFLDEEDLDELKDTEREYSVILKTPDNESEENQVIILGLKDNVNDAYAHALKLLQRYSKALTCADYIMWKYEDANNHSWNTFPLLINYYIESSYKKDNSGSTRFNMTINGKKKSMYVDFKTSIQISEEDQVHYRIKRFELSSSNSEFPSTWDSTKPRQMVTLQPSQQEYKDVIEKFKKTLPNLNPVKLERIENKRLYAQYSAQKMEVQDRLTATNKTKVQITRELFHGTSPETCEKISNRGFNRSYAGKNATAYGVGVYFARDASYSNNYAEKNQQQEKKMFLADVITGEFTTGNGSMRDAPQLSSIDLYDSVVDNINKPSIFVVFKDASVYPLYLLTYK